MKQTVEEAAKECRRTTAQSIGVYAQYHSIDECPNHGITYDEIAEAAFIKGAVMVIVWTIFNVVQSGSQSNHRG